MPNVSKAYFHLLDTTLSIDHEKRKASVVFQAKGVILKICADHNKPLPECGLTEQANCQMVSVNEHHKKMSQQLS